MITYTLLQTDIFFCDSTKNYERIKEMIEEAMLHDPVPDVLILPEDWSSGFSDEMFRNIKNYVEPINGPTVTVLKEQAKKYHVWIVGGSISTIHEDGKMRNTTFIINREGEIIGDYSKIHLYSDMDEDVAFAHGEKTTVYDTELGKLGFMICYDIRFCELSRIYALKQADVLIVTSNFPNPRVNHWRTLLTARAIENQIYVVACNRVGESPMGTYCGHSIIIDPWGEIIAEGGDNEEIIYGSFDFRKIKEIRNTIHMFRDRKPEVYERGLTEIIN